jgi:hypothetical protein
LKISGSSANSGFAGWLNRFRRLARDYERLPEALAGLHFVALRYAYARSRSTAASKFPTRSKLTRIIRVSMNSVIVSDLRRRRRVTASDEALSRITLPFN